MIRRSASLFTAVACPLLLLACGSAQPVPSSASAIERIDVHVGSPPLQGTLTLPAARAPAAAVVLISGSGPNDKDETEGPNKPFADIANGLAIDGIASIRYDKRTHEYPAQIDPRTFTATQEDVPDAVAAVQ